MQCCGPGYASPAEAMRGPRAKILYTIAIYTGTGIQKSPTTFALLMLTQRAQPIAK